MTPESPLAPDLDGWVARFRGPLVGLLASWGADWQVAEELAMDTFSEAWLGRGRLRAAVDDFDAVGAWLRGIAQNLLRAHRRRPARTVANTLDDLAAPSGSDSDERQVALRRAFAELRAEQQEVLRMHYLEATTARDVAALLGVTPKAVEMRLYQARRALRYRAEGYLASAESAGSPGGLP